MNNGIYKQKIMEIIKKEDTEKEKSNKNCGRKMSDDDSLPVNS